jgi:peptidoglycan/LPS O-acetylase OafA/YrhL
LPGYGQPSIGPGGPKLADAGLYVFFALSGYLVFQSLDGDPRIGRFLAARALRIYPGVVVNVALCLLFGAAVTNLPAAAYWGSAETWRFFLHDAAVILTPTAFQLPGALWESRWPSVNVPLWTLKYEILCYAVLLAFYKGVTLLAGERGARTARTGALAVAAAAMAAWFAYGRAHPPPPNGGLDTLGAFSEVHVVRFFAVFSAGAAYAAAGPSSRGVRWAAVGLIAAAVLAGPTPEVRFVALVLAIGLGAILLGRSRLLYSRAYHRIGDLSYGTYLYAFPIQMLTLSRWLDANNFWMLTLIDVLLALGCATLSWRFVERPALRLKRRRGVRAGAPDGSLATAHATSV